MFFHALTFAGFRGRCWNTRPVGQVLNHLPRDPDAMKQTCVIVILACFTYINQSRTDNAVKTLKYPFSYTEFLLTKWRQR